MPKEEWGGKRVCPTTGKRFYDMGRNPVVSPYSGEVVEIDTGKGSRSLVADKPKKKEKVEKEEEEDLVLEDDADLELEDDDSDVELDESTQAYQAQFSVSIADPATGEPIGAMTVGVFAEALL